MTLDELLARGQRVREYLGNGDGTIALQTSGSQERIALIVETPGPCLTTIYEFNTRNGVPEGQVR